MTKFVAVPFTADQLTLLETTLDPEVLAWALDSPEVRPPGLDNRLIRDLAALHALGKTLLAQGRLREFEFAVAAGHDMNVMYREVALKSPAEMGATAAGQLAVAKLLTTWYGLEAPDFERLTAPTNAIEFAYMGPEYLQEAVCINPKVWGIAGFTPRDVYLETLFGVKAALETADDPTALLRPYMDFPQYPLVV